jgi:hypothetical protein
MPALNSEGWCWQTRSGLWQGVLFEQAERADTMGATENHPTQRSWHPEMAPSGIRRRCGQPNCKADNGRAPGITTPESWREEVRIGSARWGQEQEFPTQ